MINSDEVRSYQTRTQIEAEAGNFEIVKHAIEISRAEFLSCRNKISDTPKHPDYINITFSKMATCFDIFGEIELALQLHEAALCSGVYACNDS